MMQFVKYKTPIRTVYHYTSKKNAQKILQEKTVRSGHDGFCFFAESLADARLLFQELMETPISYIDDQLTVQRRIPQKAEDYVILRIETQNDGSFYRFLCQQEGFNPYDKSLLHHGSLSFINAQLFSLSSLNDTQKNMEVKAEPFYRKTKLSAFRNIAAVGVLSATLLMEVLPVSAAGNSWLDKGNYDISWYEEDQPYFRLTTPQQVAGLSYLANNGNDLSGKTFEIQNDIDLTAYEWVSIPETFQGTIDGVHKLVLMLLSSQTPFATGASEFTNISFRYKENSTQITYTVDPSYMVTIPSSVTLGSDVTISAENVRVAKNSRMVVKLTGINATEQNPDGEEEFTIKTVEGASLAYNVKANGLSIEKNSTVLTVDPSEADSGSTTLSFDLANDSSIQYAGEYSGSVTFTISVENMNH